jgi:large subunit ribosomal protein L23
MSKVLVLKPRLSEQTYAQSQQNRTYVFEVAGDANKHDVMRAVTSQFNVQVESVNIVNVKGKRKATVSITGRRRGIGGSRSDAKKAYVKLVKGASLPVFAAVEEAQKQEETAQQQADKMIAKSQAKATAKTAAPAAKAAKSTSRGLRMFKKQGDK